MKSKDLKNEFKKMRVPKMDLSIHEVNNIEDFIQKIRKQDREDERYLFKRKLLPILIGLFMLTIVFMITPIRNTVLFTGCFVVYAGLVTVLILLLLDYKNISKETFNLSLLEFLKQKEARLQSWKSTPVKYNIMFAIFIIGLLMMILGNTDLIRALETTQNVIIYIGVYLIVLFLSWIIGEYFYRKRHKKKHQPLLEMISELKEELKEE